MGDSKTAVIAPPEGPLTVRARETYVLEDGTGALWLAIAAVPPAGGRHSLDTPGTVYGTKMSHVVDPDDPGPMIPVVDETPGVEVRPEGGERSFTAFRLPDPLTRAVRARLP